MKSAALTIILAVALAPAWAQDPNAGDSPDHGVARLSIVQGNVSMRHGDLGELSPAGNNVPLVVTDRVVTGDMGRAEIQFDFENMIRLAPSSEVRLSELEFKKYQIQIAAGTTEFRVLHDNDAQVEISTPTISIRPISAGTYRVTVRPDGLTDVTVRTGQAAVYGPRGSEDLLPGQTMEVRGNSNDPEFQMIAAVPPDDFDRWNADRDRAVQQTASYRPGYVPPDVTGGESLDPYGQWQNDPNYGQVWVPSEPAGWAPYQAGRWVWVDYYGWTWVSADPWGWAPYHYGSWYLSTWGWAWWPGAFGPHYYWRPAMVGFFGWGGGLGVGVGFGFGFGNVGWVPLAPFEVYHPWYGAGIVAGGRFGVTNVNVTNVYRNARYTNAISSMRAGDFGHGAVSSAGMIRPTGTDLARAGAIHGALPVSQTAASRRMADGAVNSRGMPQTAANTHFYSRGVSGAPSAGAASRASAPAASTWRGFNGNNSSVARGSAGNVGGERGASPGSNYRYATPQNQNRGYTRQQPLRMNPPIVQQRSAPTQSAPRSAPVPSRGGSSGGGSRGGGGGGGHGGGHR